MFSQKLSQNKILSRLLCTLLVLASGSVAWAQSSGGGSFGQRAERRESSRWTLQEWLAQKDRNRMMDLWLSMNSPSPFEFMLGGSYRSHKTSVDNPLSEQSYYSYAGEIRAYAQFAGLTAQYENNVQENFHDLSGMLNLRLLGDSLQNSSLTLHLGQRTRGFQTAGQANSQRNIFSQVSLQIYLARHFGLDGFYRYYEPSNNELLSEKIGGQLSEVGLFIDFKAIRLFGNWHRDVQSNEATTGNRSTIREGIRSGLQIYY